MPHKIPGTGRPGLDVRTLVERQISELGSRHAWSLFWDRSSRTYRVACNAWEDKDLIKRTNRDVELKAKFEDIVPRSATRKSGCLSAARLQIGDLPLESESQVHGRDIAFHDESLAEVTQAFRKATNYYTRRLGTHLWAMKLGCPSVWEGPTTAAAAYGLEAKLSEIDFDVNSAYSDWELAHRLVCQPDMNDTLFTFGEGQLGDPNAFALRNAKRREYARASRRVALACSQMINDQMKLIQTLKGFTSDGQRNQVMEQSEAKLRDRKKKQASILERASRAEQLADEIQARGSGVDPSIVDAFARQRWNIWDIPESLTKEELQDRLDPWLDESWMDDTSPLSQCGDTKRGTVVKGSKKGPSRRKATREQTPSAVSRDTDESENDETEKDTRSTKAILSNTFALLSPEGQKANKEHKSHQEWLRQVEQLSHAQAVKDSLLRTEAWNAVVQLIKHNRHQKKLRLAREEAARRSALKQSTVESDSRDVSPPSQPVSDLGPASEAPWAEIRKTLWMMAHLDADPASHKDEPPPEFAQMLQEELAKSAKEAKRTNKSDLAIRSSPRGTATKGWVPPSQRSLVDYLKTEKDRQRYLNSLATNQTSLRRFARRRGGRQSYISRSRTGTTRQRRYHPKPPTTRDSLWSNLDTEDSARLSMEIAVGLDHLTSQQLVEFEMRVQLVSDDEKTLQKLSTILKQVAPKKDVFQLHSVGSSSRRGNHWPTRKSHRAAGSTHPQPTLPTMNEEALDIETEIDEQPAAGVYRNPGLSQSAEELSSPKSIEWEEERDCSLNEIQEPTGSVINKRLRAWSESETDRSLWLNFIHSPGGWKGEEEEAIYV